MATGSAPKLEQINFGGNFKGEVVAMLESNNMFTDFERQELRTLADYCQAYLAPVGTIVFNEGDQSSYLCLLVEGKLSVLKDSDGEKSKKLVDVRPGKTIGEMSVIDGLPYSATVKASANSKLILITKENFAKITEDHPRLGVKILWKFSQLLSLRLRQTSGKLIDLL